MTVSKPFGQWRAVIVGAGPSGFYAADQLLAAGFEVDLLDALLTPFGLGPGRAVVGCRWVRSVAGGCRGRVGGVALVGWRQR